MDTSDYHDLGGVFLPGAFVNDFARGFAGPPGDFLVDDERSEVLVDLSFGHLPAVPYGKGRLEELEFARFQKARGEEDFREFGVAGGIEGVQCRLGQLKNPPEPGGEVSG